MRLSEALKKLLLVRPAAEDSAQNLAPFCQIPCCDLVSHGARMWGSVRLPRGGLPALPRTVRVGARPRWPLRVSSARHRPLRAASRRNARVTARVWMPWQRCPSHGPSPLWACGVCPPRCEVPRQCSRGCPRRAGSCRAFGEASRARMLWLRPSHGWFPLWACGSRPPRSEVPGRKCRCPPPWGRKWLRPPGAGRKRRRPPPWGRKRRRPPVVAARAVR